MTFSAPVYKYVLGMGHELKGSVSTVYRGIKSQTS
jgi:hypothetical protein